MPQEENPRTMEIISQTPTLSLLNQQICTNVTIGINLPRQLNINTCFSMTKYNHYVIMSRSFSITKTEVMFQPATGEPNSYNYNLEV